MNTFEKKIPIPDLRFENSFLRSLQRYADSSAGKNDGPITDSELQLLDEQNTSLGEPEELKPVGPITPSIVTYAVIKDIILRPLIEGFSWAMIVILFRPTLGLITAQGHRAGTWLATVLGKPTARGFGL
ncbi:hypothetical protein JCM33374_g4462 [Metschnikowia sp. JCM 33374]|nr:hypothetical protein JCM33374_g4462 [Metschnikowia sp. JCM 33374]